MTREEAILYLEHTGSDDFNLEEHQIQNRLNAIQFLLEENQELKEAIDKINHILNNQINYREFVDIVNAIEDVVKEVE